MAIQEWKHITPNFSGSNAAMSNAMQSISQAGTVFEKMREGILAEEQRAIENQRAQDELNETIRANQALEDYRAGQLANEQERLRLQEAVNASEIERNQALTKQTMAKIDQDNANKRAWQLAVKGIDALSPQFQTYDNLLKAQAVTREAFDKDKLTNTDKSIYKDYADYDAFQKANTAEIAKIEQWLTDNGINKADFTGLGTTHGRVNMLEKAFAANGGFGSVKDYLSIADTNGLIYETDKMKQDAATKAEWAKKERDLATPNGIDAQLKPYSMNDDARNALNQLALTLITNKGNSTLSNQDILNDLITRTVLPGMDANAITRAYRYFAGNPNISFKTKEDLDAVLETAGLKAASGAVGSGTVLGNSGSGNSSGKTEIVKPTPEQLVPFLPKESQDALSNDLESWRTMYTSLNGQEPSEKEVQAAREAMINRAVKSTGANLSAPNLDIHKIKQRFSDEALRQAGILNGKQASFITQEQFNTLMKQQNVKYPSMFMTSDLNPFK